MILQFMINSIPFLTRCTCGIETKIENSTGKQWPYVRRVLELFRPSTGTAPVHTETKKSNWVRVVPALVLEPNYPEVKAVPKPREPLKHSRVIVFPALESFPARESQRTVGGAL